MANKAILVGCVWQDPTIHVFENGKVASFSLATNETYKDKNGEKKTVTEWHNIKMSGKLAELAEKYVKKGNMLYVEGAIKTQKYDKDGQTHYFTSIVVNVMSFLPSGNKQSQHQETQEAESLDPESTEDLPF